MKVFFKWALKGLLLLLVVIIYTAFTNEFDESRLPLVIGVIVGGALMLGGLFYFIEVYYLPKRKIKLTNKVISVFNATQITNEIFHGKIASFDVYIVVQFNLRMSMYTGNIEVINFHVPRKQIELLTKVDFKLKEDNCNAFPTYNVFQTNGYGIKRAKKRLIKSLI